MSDDARRIRVAEDVLRYFTACTKSVQLYAADHPIVARAVEQLVQTLERAHAEEPTVVVGIVDRQVVVDGYPLAGVHGAADSADRLRAVGIERIAIDRGVAGEELLEFVRGLAAAPPYADDAGDDTLAALSTPHIHVGRLHLQQRLDAGAGDMRAMRRAYQHAVAGAEAVWSQALAEGGPDPGMATRLVDGLASAVGQNRRAMLALAAMHWYDNYTFTHMVNVSVLMMAQARGLGIDGTLLRQFGLAGLMHDIGKIRTPAEILTKPDKLTESEFAIMMRHPVDGAAMLRRRLELPPLAAAVAFEHHLRLDGTGYPGGVARPALNLATQLCGIADVFDAMRSQRNYQRAFPTDRILAVLQQNDGSRFDRRLVRRFSQLLGIYPTGNLVRLADGALAVVLRVHAPDPARPLVRVVAGPDGARLATPRDVALWVDDGPDGPPPRIVTPVDPADAGIDPLACLDDAAA
ncbi:MAG: HD-GYP domain-containing protein [Vicinamibacterales bacterium]